MILGSDNRDMEMNGLAIFRRHRTAWGRRVLSTFIVAWLAIILQPCAVAAGVEHECPHCPPGATHETSHFEVTASADCALSDQLNIESRSLQVKLEDTFNNVPVTVAPESHEIEKSASIAQRSPGSAVFLSLSRPSLNVLYCVYLK